MIYGILRGIAPVWIKDRWVFRFCVVTNHDFQIFYVGASNYGFRYGDIVSWGDGVLYWHAETRTIKFDLLQTGVEAK
jgi:hypothetical protein